MHGEWTERRPATAAKIEKSQQLTRRVKGFRLADSLKPCGDPYSAEASTISIRRFKLRFSGESFGAIGWYSP